MFVHRHNNNIRKHIVCNSDSGVCTETCIDTACRSALLFDRVKSANCVNCADQINNVNDAGGIIPIKCSKALVGLGVGALVGLGVGVFFAVNF